MQKYEFVLAASQRREVTPFSEPIPRQSDASAWRSCCVSLQQLALSPQAETSRVQPTPSTASCGEVRRFSQQRPYFYTCVTNLVGAKTVSRAPEVAISAKLAKLTFESGEIDYATSDSDSEPDLDFESGAADYVTSNSDSETDPDSESGASDYATEDPGADRPRITANRHSQRYSRSLRPTASPSKGRRRTSTSSGASQNAPMSNGALAVYKHMLQTSSRKRTHTSGPVFTWHPYYNETLMSHIKRRPTASDFVKA